MGVKRNMENKCTYGGSILKVLESRSSCRSYTGEQITDEQLEVLLEAGNAAPVAMNRVNDIKLYVIQDTCLLEKLEITTQRLFSQIDYHMKGLYEVPTLIIVAVRKLKVEDEGGEVLTSALQL